MEGGRESSSCARDSGSLEIEGGGDAVAAAPQTCHRALPLLLARLRPC